MACSVGHTTTASSYAAMSEMHMARFKSPFPVDAAAYEKFLSMVRDGGAPEVSLADGRRAVEIGEAAEKSARTDCARR